jgi:hypothetical protein
MNLFMETSSSAQATVGTMATDEQEYFTLELSWDNNAPDKSCVPAGIYDLIPYDSPTHGATWRLHNPSLNVYGTGLVPEGGRSEVEIHSANWCRQLLGCIALGLEGQPMLDPMTGCVEPAVENSRDAVAMLIAELGAMSYGHSLTIVRDSAAIASI